MFDISCSHCGYPENVHFDPERFKEYAAKNLWPGTEYFDSDFPFFPNKQYTTIEDVAHKQGYRFRLSTCPGFTIPRRKLTYAMNGALELEEAKPWVVEWIEILLPNNAAEQFEKLLAHQRRRRKKAAKEYSPSPNVAGGGGSTIIIYDPRTSATSVGFFGE